MKKIRHRMQTIAAAFLTLAAIATSIGAPATIDFEQPTYTAGNSFIGVSNWNDLLYGASVTTITPNESITGAVFVLQGTQSAYVAGSVRKSFSSMGADAGDLGEISWLQATPDGLSVPTYGYQGLLLASNVGSSTPVGIAAFKDADDAMRVRLFSGITVWTNTDVVYQTGQQSPTELNQIYRFYMQLDFENHTMTGFYSLGNDYESGGASATKFLLGTVGIDPALTADEIAQNYGVGLMMSGGNALYDSLTVAAIPEPKTVLLLGLGALGALVLVYARKEKAPGKATN